MRRKTLAEVLTARRFPVIYALLLAVLIALSAIRFHTIAPPQPQIFGNAGYRALWQNDVSTSVASFTEALNEDPGFPYRWSDLGEAWQAMGNRTAAAQCFDRAVALAPHAAPIGLRAANFYFSTGDTERGLALGRDVLRETADLDPTIFRTYSRFGGSLDHILDAGIGDNPRAAEAFFAFLLNGGQRDQLESAWRWINLHGAPSPSLTRAWAKWLLQAGNPAQAATVWRGAPVDPAWGRSTRVDNGGFEADPIPGGAFDWSIRAVSGVKVTIDATMAHSGARSLRLAVEADENLDYHDSSEPVWLEPGTWRLEGWVRTRDFSSDHGIGFGVVSPAGKNSPELSVFTPDLTGTHDWTPVTADFTISGAPRLVELRVVRRPTWDFDNHPHGTAWVDDVAIRRLR